MTHIQQIKCDKCGALEPTFRLDRAFPPGWLMLGAMFSDGTPHYERNMSPAERQTYFSFRLDFCPKCADLLNTWVATREAET